MRAVPAFFMFALASFAATAATALGQTATATPTPTANPSPSPVPGGMDPVAADFQLSLIVWLSTLALAAVCSWAYFVGRASDRSASGGKNGRNDTAKTSPGSTPVTDKDLENSRISYGFWLIIAGFLITLAVVIVTMNHFRGTNSTADVVAVVTAVTGVIGTLTAAFFGIQAAGAGRSQALSALSDQMKNGSSSVAASYKIDPIAGPHDGNTRVSLIGNGFTGASAVNFGSIPGVNPQFANDGVGYVTSPALQLDRTATTQDGKSDVDVTIVFPGAAAQNKVIGKFYYYTVDVEKDADGKPYVNVYGSGLAGASQVEFGSFGTLAVEKATDAVLQIRVKYDVPAKKPDPGETTDPNNADFWAQVWNKEVDVAVIFGTDATATKRMVIGKYRIPQYTPPTPTKPDPNAAGGGSAPSGDSSDSS